MEDQRAEPRLQGPPAEPAAVPHPKPCPTKDPQGPEKPRQPCKRQPDKQTVGNHYGKKQKVSSSDNFTAKSLFQNKEFKAGRLKEKLPFWKTMTTDSNILKAVTGCEIEFDSEPTQQKLPLSYKFPETKKVKISAEVNQMLKKGIIEKINLDENTFVSNIFSKPKKDGSFRIILDLTELNKHVTYRHFKMDTLQTALDLMTPNCYMASVDWKDAYYSVPVATDMRKFLVFRWEGEAFQYTCLPNGLACAPRVFTKLTKVIFSQLRKIGHVSTSYIDDCLLLAKTSKACVQNIKATIELSEKAGFLVHDEKSVLKPTQKIVYLGFWLDSTNMTITLTSEKAQKIKVACKNLLQSQKTSIKNLSRVVGLLVASIPGVQYGKLLYRSLDNHKSAALKENKGDFTAQTELTQTCKQDLLWWAENIEHESRNIITPKPDVVIETDASDMGWGACIKGDSSQSTGGHWSELESMEHINYRELLAAWFGIQCFNSSRSGIHIKILSDNTTTVAYLNNMGGTKKKCNNITRQIWSWCHSRKNWISAAHLPGKKNLQADKESRSIHDNMEWSLHPEAFQQICKTFGKPDIDLFASRLNHKLEKYMSWKPDPNAIAVDAMSENWDHFFFYAFPPFNMIGKVLNKVEIEKCKGIVVVPHWPTQPWWPKFSLMCCAPPIVLSRFQGQLLTHQWRKEGELPKMTLMAGLISAPDLD